VADAAKLPWGELSVDVVLDCTGVYGSREDGETQLKAGAKKILFAHPGGHDLDATVVYGVGVGQRLALSLLMNLPAPKAWLTC